MKKDVGRVETDEKLNELERRIAKIYSQASKEVLEKAEHYLSAFADRDKEMRSMVDQKQMTEAEYKEWKRKTLMSNQRWLNLRDSLAKDMNNANKIARSVTQETMPEVYAINHNWSTYQAEKGALANTNYMLYDRSTVERLLQDDPDIMPLASKGVNSKKDTEWNKKVIDSVLLQGILQGESINNMSKRFEQVGVRNHETAVRYARTATTGAENAGRTDGYKRAQKMGIKIKKVWFATLDDRTRDSHRELDGETREVDEPFSNGCLHPGDPKADDPSEVWNCRCTLITKVNGADFNTGEIERASKLGNMTYDEWKNGHKDEPKSPEQKPEKESESQKEDSDLAVEIEVDAEHIKQEANVIREEQISKRESEPEPEAEPEQEKKIVNSSYCTKDEYKALLKQHNKNISKQDKKQIANHKQPDGSNGGYVASYNYKNINSNLRNDGFITQPLTEDDRATIESLRNAIEANTLGGDYTLTRWVNATYITSMYGIEERRGGIVTDNVAYRPKDLEHVISGLNDIVGNEYTEKAFVSTSMIPSKNVVSDGKAICFIFKADANTHCYVPDNKKESECILGENTKYRIDKVAKRIDGVIEITATII